MSNVKTESTGDPPLARHQILHHLRCSLEGSHRETLHRYSTRYPCLFEPRIDQVDDFPDLKLEQADDCCNKTVPVYVCAEGYDVHIRLLLLMLHNWLYRKWFRPYRSDIEYGQYIAKTILPKGIPPDASVESKVNEIIALHRAICQATQKARQKIIDFNLDEQVDAFSGPMGFLSFRSVENTIKDQRYFILQPTFQAIAIMVIGNSFTEQVNDMGQNQVYIIRTGFEDGLSSPIILAPIVEDVSHVIYDANGTIKAVSTTLDRAYTFVEEVRDREVAVFGDGLELVKWTEEFHDGYLMASQGILSRAKKLGWEDDALQGPSSTWVDTSQYSVWTGAGEDYDTRIVTDWERFFRGAYTVMPRSAEEQ